MDGSLVIVTPPGSEPVTLQEAKDWCRGPTSADDTLITALIIAARRYVEKVSSRALVTQTWDYWLDYFPGSNWYGFQTPTIWSSCWELKVPRPPLQSISSIKYIDTSGNQQTVSSSDYTVDVKREPGRVVPAYQKVWPTPRSGIPNAVQVTFVAGYGAASAVPEELKNAIKTLVATMYEQREMLTEASTGQELTRVPIAFWNLVNEFRAWTL